jgi:hypothetical protein
VFLSIVNGACYIAVLNFEMFFFFNFQVRYESFASAVAKDELGAQGLDSSVTAEVECFKCMQKLTCNSKLIGNFF